MTSYLLDNTGSADIDGAFSIGQKEKILVFCILFRLHRLSVSLPADEAGTLGSSAQGGQASL
jgi:hypothetical protein